MQILKSLNSLGQNKRGATAVEFALVAPVFFALIFSTLEAGWYFFVTSAVEQANSNAARLIRTGQAQKGNVSRDAFYDEICDVVGIFGSCSDKLTIDVARFANFAALAADTSQVTCRDRDDPTIEGAQFTDADYGVQREIVRVRVCFLYKPINPALGLNLQRTKHGDREITAVSIFRNEPYES